MRPVRLFIHRIVEPQPNPGFPRNPSLAPLPLLLQCAVGSRPSDGSCLLLCLVWRETEPGQPAKPTHSSALLHGPLSNQHRCITLLHRTGTALAPQHDNRLQPTAGAFLYGIPPLKSVRVCGVRSAQGNPDCTHTNPRAPARQMVVRITLCPCLEGREEPAKPGATQWPNVVVKTAPIPVPNDATENLAAHHSFLPRGRKARRSLSGRGGGAPRPPATLSCKADPGDYPAGLALP